MKVCQASVASCSPLFSSKFPPPSPHHPRKQRPRTSHCSPAVQALATADLALRIAMEASLGERKSLGKKEKRGRLEQACCFSGPLLNKRAVPTLNQCDLTMSYPSGKKPGGPENPKARQRTARFLKKKNWRGQPCSARNRCKIFIETSCTLMASGATTHHSMLRHLRLHSFSRYFC